jgi:hypothetical protein
LGENGIGDLFAGDVVFQDEIFVGNRGEILELHGGRTGAGAVDLDGVGGRTYLHQGHAGVDGEFDGDVVPGARALGRNRRRDFGGVRNLVGVRRPAAALLADSFAGDVSGADDHGKYKLVGTVFVFEGLQVSDGDGDLLARQDVGHGLGEDVGALLVEQGGDVSGLPGFVVDGARFFALADDSAHGAVADLHGHVVNGGVFGQRECIDRFDRLRSRVLEGLSDGDAGEESADAAAHFGVTKRACAFDRSRFVEDAERSGAFVGRRRNCRLCGPQNHGGQDEQRKADDQPQGVQTMALHRCLRN